MEENELLENEIEEEASSEFNSEEDSPEGENVVTQDQVIDALREIINENVENDIEGDNLQLLSDNSPSVSPTPSVIDYTQLLIDIKNQQIQTNSSLSTLIEDHEKTIFDKTLSEYTITESILVFLVVFGLCTAFIGLIKKFTPKLWR